MLTSQERRRDRKTARTRIYTALYGHGGKTNNQPWSARRTRPEGWSLGDAQQVIRTHWRAAQFDHFRAGIVLDDADMDLSQVQS